jgi:hypothetical protein
MDTTEKLLVIYAAGVFKDTPEISADAKVRPDNPKRLYGL